jgi:hypothetical protein
LGEELAVAVAVVGAPDGRVAMGTPHDDATDTNKRGSKPAAITSIVGFDRVELPEAAVLFEPRAAAICNRVVTSPS